eukprot:Skav208835  [mRNA]  locus=scaffold1193:97225:110524:+ [translate_table: standard]
MNSCAIQQIGHPSNLPSNLGATHQPRRRFNETTFHVTAMGTTSEWRRTAEHFVCGGVAGMVARTVIAPVERIKIIYQINSKHSTGDQGWLRIIKKVMDESGGGHRTITDFWKGNSVAVLRVFPYLGVQLASNETLGSSCEATQAGGCRAWTVVR